MKHYTSQTGYVYQYFYLGQRPWRRAGVEATEYVFEISSAARDWKRVSVLLAERELAAREARLGRALISAERYAVAKMTLFQAFDERPHVEGELQVRSADLDAILGTLGIE